MPWQLWSLILILLARNAILFLTVILKYLKYSKNYHLIANIKFHCAAHGQISGCFSGKVFSLFFLFDCYLFKKSFFFLFCVQVKQIFYVTQFLLNCFSSPCCFTRFAAIIVVSHYDKIWPTIFLISKIFVFNFLFFFPLRSLLSVNRFHLKILKLKVSKTQPASESATTIHHLKYEKLMLLFLFCTKVCSNIFLMGWVTVAVRNLAPNVFKWLIQMLL